MLATRSQLGVSYSRVQARSLFSFSAQVSLQNLGHYVNNILPSFAVSRFLGQASLGFFSRASMLVGLPQTFLAQGVQKTLYPIYPRFRDNKEECRRMMIDVASVTTTMVWPLFAALAGLAPLVVEFLLGARWAPAASIVGPLCLYATANFAYAIFASFAESFGHLRQIWLVQACWTVALVCSLGIAVRADADMRAIVLVAAGVQIAVHVLQITLLARVATRRRRGHAARGSLGGAGRSGLVHRDDADDTLTVRHGMAMRIVASCGVVALLDAGHVARASPPSRGKGTLPTRDTHRLASEVSQRPLGDGYS